MLDILSEGFKKASQALQGKATLTEANVAEALGEIRRSLLEADVEYTVVRSFLDKVKEKALGQEVALKAGKSSEKIKVSPGDHFIKICKDELESLMGPVDTDLHLPLNRPAVVMMVGLQGSGKTTTTGKIAKFLMRSHKRKPLLVAADIYRPAAVNQLKVLGEKIQVPVFHLPETSPVEICKQASRKALELDCDTVLLDTAGRLTIDTALMDELSAIKASCKPDSILLVCDAMMGQDAVTTAKAFHERLGLSGIVMTKLDGDARGGAALSMKEVTGAPIKFLGMGEDLDRLEEFRPEGLASRILGMGDIVGLMEDFERVADGDREDETLRMLSGQFNFKDFYEQIAMIQKMGSLKDIIAKLPMQNMLPKGVQVDDKELVKIKSMIDSMTERERLQPELFNSSRARRIAQGSGRSLQEVTELVKRFKSMRSMMGQLGKGMFGGMLNKIPGMGGLAQMNQMRKMALASAQGGGSPFGGGLEGMLGAMGAHDKGPAGPSLQGFKRVDRDKIKKARQAAKKNRKKNRKK